MTLLERLEASLAAAAKAKGQEPDLEHAAAQEVLRLRGAAAMEATAALRFWIDEGRALVNQLWDLADAADSPALCALLGELTDRETGVIGALGMLVRHVEDTLGKRHGRGGIEDGDGTIIAAVDRQAGSVKWQVDDAWPAITAGIRKAGRLPIGDPEDGEMEDDTAKALRIVKALCGIGYLKVGECEALGIDPDDYRTKAGYRWVVKTP